MVERTNEEWLAGLDFGRLGVEEGGEELEFGGKWVASCKAVSSFTWPYRASGWATM